MSQENLEMSRLMTDAFNRRDVEAVVALWDDEGVWYPAIEASVEGSRTYRGHAGMRQYFKDLAELARGYAEFSKLDDLGNRVLGVGHLSMKFASGPVLCPRWQDDQARRLHGTRPCPCRPRPGGVGDVAGEIVTTAWSSPATNEIGEVSAYF